MEKQPTFNSALLGQLTDQQIEIQMKIDTLMMKIGPYVFSWNPFRMIQYNYGIHVIGRLHAKKMKLAARSKLEMEKHPSFV